MFARPVFAVLATSSWLVAQEPPADRTQRERNAESYAALRTLVDEEYSYRDRVVADWDALFESKREEVLAADNDAEFAVRIGGLLGAARDPHIWIGPLERRALTYQEPRPANYDLRTIEREITDLEKPNDTVWYGTIRDGERRVGFLLVRSLSNPIQSDLAVAQDALDEFASTCDAVVLDLRPNGGGNEILAMPIAGWFVEGVKVYAGHVRKSPRTGQWDERSERRIFGRRRGRGFPGPVAVLIGPHCTSACEAFVLMMKQAERGVLVGARTGGSSGNPVPHELPNGIVVWIPSWRATDAAGVVFEGVGIAPDIPVEAAPQDFRERDPVLAAALRALRER